MCAERSGVERAPGLRHGAVERWPVAPSASSSPRLPGEGCRRLLRGCGGSAPGAPACRRSPCHGPGGSPAAPGEGVRRNARRQSPAAGNRGSAEAVVSSWLPPRAARPYRPPRPGVVPAAAAGGCLKHRAGVKGVPSGGLSRAGPAGAGVAEGKSEVSLRKQLAQGPADRCSGEVPEQR